MNRTHAAAAPGQSTQSSHKATQFNRRRTAVTLVSVRLTAENAKLAEQTPSGLDEPHSRCGCPRTVNAELPQSHSIQQTANRCHACLRTANRGERKARRANSIR